MSSPNNGISHENDNTMEMCTSDAVKKLNLSSLLSTLSLCFLFSSSLHACFFILFFLQAVLVPKCCSFAWLPAAVCESNTIIGNAANSYKHSAHMFL